MSKVDPRTPSGFPEYLPSEQIEFNRLVRVIRQTYEKYGFAPIDTSDLELSEVLLTKSGGETEQQIYRFTKGSTDLTMRFDLTIPLARYTAQHEHELIFPFRRYQIGKVHRGERAQAGRFREFYQADIDVIGTNSPVVDAEMPCIINEIFTKLNFGEFVIRLNNRQILNGFFDSVGLGDSAAEILRLIDKLDKLTPAEFSNSLAKAGLSDKQIDQVCDFTSITGSSDNIIAALYEMGLTSEVFNNGVRQLEQLIAILRTMQVPENRFQIDLKIARGLDYYTGVVYETTLVDHPELGSICSGGRYDNLAEHYTKTNLPGVGISIGITRLFDKLLALGLITPSGSSPAKIVVIPFGTDQLAPAMAVANELRAANHPAVLYSEFDAVKKALRYADRMNFQWAILIGEDEAASNSLTLKNMSDGTNQLIPTAALIELVNSGD